MSRYSLLLLTFTMLGACAEPTSTNTPTPLRATETSSSISATAAENRALATLRSSTARFHRYDVAKDAGYTFLFMNMCMDDDSPAKLGSMGYHYVNTALLDGRVDVATPEAVLYEPGKNGQLNLVAVEYVIPKTAWTSSAAPELFGKKFKLNKFDLWALHVWVWEDNPSGLYADWNPNVSCANASH